ncbi:arsenate-mycothiol transferase ArsC [Nesterenkonia flava]|uniref:Low molecular weight phosphatase family protein n=1 Tax=Nesterenkonia flava TaxID=469799 RepID=A0ABU1FUB3_9MICC|nr:low molecular weight phosphatase family protein [Nesterenkonia flava]MDR5712208.1 low molecular weight phosphatase family protein [Nesterenkonia flava]
MTAQTSSPAGARPAVLFVCVKNGGKSQMAAGLMRKVLADAGTPDAVMVASAGTRPGSSVNALSVEVLADVGVDISAQVPQQLTERAMHEAGYVVVLGSEAQVEPPEGVTLERWETDEPSLRGIEGRQRMELIREDIYARVQKLADRLRS